MIDVLVLCKDRPDFLTECIARLDAQNVDYDGLLIDNSLETERAAMLARSHGWRVVDGEDWNYAHSLNVGMASTRSSHVLWLSDDAYLHDGCLAELLDAEKPIVSPLLLSSDGKVCFAGGEFDGWNPVHVGRGDDPVLYEGRGTVATQWVTTPAALVRRDVFDAVGGLDESYSWSHEDVDFCLSARRLGFDPFVCFDGRATHDEAQTKLPQMRPHVRGNVTRFLSKWRNELVGV